MNKKILFFGVLAVLMLVAISFATAVTTNTQTTTIKESPLFGIRTNREIGEKVNELKDNIRANYLKGRIFLSLPLFKFHKTDSIVLPSPGVTGGCLISICTKCVIS